MYQSAAWDSTIKVASVGETAGIGLYNVDDYLASYLPDEIYRIWPADAHPLADNFDEGCNQKLARFIVSCFSTKSVIVNFKLSGFYARKIT